MAQSTQSKSMLIDQDAVKKAIENAVYSNFGEGDVASIDIQFDDDGYDADIVNVAVILNREVDKKQVSGFSLKLRNALDKVNSEWFPLVSFINKNEYRGRRAD
jgi:hypothetical protein